MRSRSIIPRWISAAQRTASMTLANSANKPSPVFYGTALVLPDLRIDQLRDMRPEALVRACLVRAHQARVARDVGRQNRSQTPLDPFLRHDAVHTKETRGYGRGACGR